MKDTKVMHEGFLIDVKDAEFLKRWSFELDSESGLFYGEDAEGAMYQYYPVVGNFEPHIVVNDGYDEVIDKQNEI